MMERMAGGDHGDDLAPAELPQQRQRSISSGLQALERTAAASSMPDEAFAQMSRRERIALLEQTGDGGESGPSRRQRASDRALDRGGAAPAPAAETPRSRRVRPTRSPIDKLGAGDCGDPAVDGVWSPPERSGWREQADRGGPDRPPDSLDALTAEAGLGRRRREPPDRGGSCAHSDAAAEVGLSRRERMALREQAGHDSNAAGAEDAPLSARMAPRWRAEDGAGQRRACSESRRQAAVRGVSVHSCGNDADDAEEEKLSDAWLEQRRQNRKLRLQKGGSTRPPPRGAEATAAAPATGGNELGAAEVALQLDRTQRGAARATGNATARVAAEGGGSAGASASPLEDLEEVQRLEAGSVAWATACARLATGAHRLQSSGLVRAIEVLACSSSSPTGGALPSVASDEQALGALRGLAESLLGCLTPQLGTLGGGVVTEALRVMAAGKVEEQTFLDMLLARLLVTLRHEPLSFSKVTLASAAGALGALHEAGVSARRAASGASSSANKRCIEALGGQIATGIDDFGEEDLARLGGPFVVAFLDDDQRRTVLRRAVELQAGLQTAAGSWLAVAMQGTERALRRHSFAFIAGLPDQTKDYLMRLKMAADHASKTPG